MTGATAGLILLSPVLLVAGLVIRVTMGSPVFWRQTRIGRRERPFRILKLRTMHDTRDATGRILSDGERLSSVGSVLRKTSIDELPQLWNVLKGEMSLVGPRPLYVDYLPCYTVRERCRHTVRPGITGLAQVRGRNQLLWDERLELDVQYVSTQSLALDVRILIVTIRNVLTRRGVITVPGSVQGPLTRYRPALMERTG